MIHPSYTELIDAVNERYEGEGPLVQSRYSIVHAAARRARQLVSGAEPFVESKYELDKPLTIAVDELYEGYVKILPEGTAEELEEEEFFYEDEADEAEDSRKAEDSEKTEVTEESAATEGLEETEKAEEAGNVEEAEKSEETGEGVSAAASESAEESEE